MLSIALTALTAASLSASTPTIPNGGEAIPILLVSGANNHWWQWTGPSLAEMLEESGYFAVTVTTDPSRDLADAQGLAAYKAVVLDYNGPRWGTAAEQTFLRAVREGLGVSVVHAANNPFNGWKEYEEMVALCWRKGTGHGRFHPFDVEITDRYHPITRDMDPLIAHPDELYHNLVHMHGTDYRILATAYSAPETGGSGKPEPMVIVKEFGQGRVFHTPLGHVWTDVEATKVSHLDPAFRDLIVRGTQWAATGKVRSGHAQANVLTDAERAAGWELMFDGVTSDGWRGYRREKFPEKGWAIEDGTIHKVALEGGGDIISERSFRDFEFAFDWRVVPGANSGVFYRVTEDHNYAWETGPEYQILDDELHHDGRNPLTSAASLYGMIPPNGKRPSEVGEWNRGRIVVIGNHVEHWLNGSRLLSYDLHSGRWKGLVESSKFNSMPDFGMSPAGHIVLQDHGDDVWFRNLRVRSMDAVEKKEVALFNGKDLTGWTYYLNDKGKPEDVWEVTEDGVLVCKGRPIGYLRTKADHTNYTLSLKWRFSPITKKAGNSGVLLRLIGDDKVWPRSIEAQLQSGAAGDFWNIGDFPMSAVKERTRGRNTARMHTNENPIGEWNTYEITVWHGHCVLRVNGMVLNQAWSCMEIPGKIGLQSEGAEIHFRDIRLMPLP
jgi:type 1 glutamine amidotransferase